MEFTQKGTNNIDIQFNDKVSGVLNTINYFEAYSQLVGLGKTTLNWHPNINQFIRCINDYDMWEWKYDDTAAVNACLSTFTDEDNIAFVYDLINNQEKMGVSEVSKLYENMVETGKVIRRNQEKRVDSITNKYIEVRIPMSVKTDTVSVNRTYSFAVVNSIMDKNECADVFTKNYDFAIVWAFQGNYITGSIRAQKDKLDGFMDANLIANLSEYGMVGGGHPVASGFSIKDPVFITKFLEKFVYGAQSKKLS
jgi:oligoribonuclease NrnB/cAMP/cGMP phosphodiesterase (DHH superfamily)